MAEGSPGRSLTRRTRHARRHAGLDPVLVQLRGRRVGLSHGNGVESTFGYDDRIRLVRLEHATGGDVFESCGYVNDFAGRDRLREARR